ncbi:MAG: hypothetical protein K2X93_13600 [Candidatus Obscuribacterales bacterium]|nr:hypothetical protein [Candidatus Obscuribacterales bacterium]
MYSMRTPANVHTAEYPDLKFNVSMTVDPLIVDDLQREAKEFPIVRIMERTNFRSEDHAQKFMNNLVMSARLGEDLAATKEEQSADSADLSIILCH